MGTINLQTASEFEISKLPISRYDVEDILKVRKNVQQFDPTVWQNTQIFQRKNG